MRAVLVARDVAPSLALAKVADYLKRDESNDVRSLLGNGKPMSNPLHPFNLVEGAEVILLGMSSAPNLAEEEIAVAQVAAEMGMPFGFYADTFNCHARAWFAPFREKASFLFVINENEGRSARELFPNAKVVASGNPMWEDFFTPKLSREEVRRKLEVNDDQRMILCPGGKLPIVNFQHFGGVIAAAAMLGKEASQWKLILAIHPGDEDYNKNNALYDALAKYSKSPVAIVPKSVMPISEIIPGCDVVVESASTIGIEAVCQRKPVVNFFSETALNRLESVGGSRDWTLCDQEAAARVDYDPSRLANKIAELLFCGKYEPMRKQQELHYPTAPEKGAAVRQMAETLKEFAGARKN